MADTDARTDMRFAQKYLENKQFDEARDYIASARRKDPDVTLAIKTESKEVAELTPDSLEADILFQQSLSYAEQIQKLEAEKEKIYKDSVKTHERNAEKWHKSDWSPKEALDQLRKEQIANDYDWQVYSGRMREFHNQIDYLTSQAIKCLEQAIKLNPNVPNYHAFLGGAYVEQKNFVGALELLTPAQQRWPEHFEIRRSLDSALKGQKLQESLATAPSPATPSFKTQTIVSLLSIFLGLICFFIAASFAKSGNETTIIMLGTTGLVCFVVALIARLWI
jgi:tetratricopeptide (TPR) repeat protein